MKAGWEAKQLGEVCAFQRGLTYSKKDEVDSGGTSVLRATNVDLETGELDLSEIRFIRSEVPVPPSKMVEPGTLLICTASGSKKHLGKTALIDRPMNFAFGGFMGLLKPDEGLLPKYLQWLMRSDDYWAFIDGLSDGANINNLKFKQLAEFPIPLPPLEEQQRIVAVLDEAFEGLTRARSHAEANLQNAQDLFESLRFVMLSEQTEGWETHPLADCFRLKSGENLTAKKMVPGPFPVYGGNGIAGTHDACNLTGDNVIIGRVGALCGNARYIDHDIWLTDNAFKVVNYNFDFDHRFLAYLLNFKNLRSLARQAAQPVISNSSLADLELTFPASVELQAELANKLSDAETKLEDIKKKYEAKMQDIDDLRQSLLQKAFAGELT